MTLNYDIVFLALIRMALTGDKLEIKPKRCFVHPFKKRPSLVPNETLRYCAKASALLTYYKIADNVKDSKGLKKLFAVISLIIFRIFKKNIDGLDTEVISYLNELDILEKAQTQSVDAPAEIFGKLLAAVFAHGLEIDQNKRIAYEIGLHVGRWIYITDAVHDFEQDKKHGTYNPLTDINKDIISTALTLELTHVEKAIDLININEKSIENLIKNIIYLGMAKESSYGRSV